MEFKVVKNEKELVLVEVIFTDVMDKMSNKGFEGNEKYIKFTKGRNHTITVYDENSTSLCSFNFGDNGFTLISDELSILQSKVYKFLLSQHIQPTKMTDKLETNLTIMPPRSGLGIKDHFCVHLGGELALFLNTEAEIKDLFGDYEIYDTTIAVTGITVHEAKLI